MEALDSSAAPSVKANSQQEFSEEHLRQYYKRLFPYDAMYKWLSYGQDASAPNSATNDNSFFSRREWSFTMENDIYIRYQSFKDQKEMTAAIQSRQPHKIDIGAVFSECPAKHNSIEPELFQPVERELVFDIDITDYDNIRTCCKGADICRRCWPYMTMAVKVLNRSLREDFAFQHILWVYSGRRGIHCWVTDPIARELTNEARSAIVEYLTVHVGSSENSDKRLKNAFTAPMHPAIRSAYALLEPMFGRFIADDAGQGMLARKDRYIALLNTLPHDGLRRELADEWERNPTASGQERWRQLCAVTTSPTDAASSLAARKKRINFVELEAWRVELVFTHCYPRLDANVSKARNHLLKSPFCIHPGTGRVCVPINPDEAEKFDPFTVPTVRSLCQEIDTYDHEHGVSDEAISDIQKTSMRTIVGSFENLFLRGLYKTIHKDKREKADLAAAMSVDF